MDHMIKLKENNQFRPRIKVLGVGGGGCNALNTMISKGLEKVDFIAINTDMQSLENSMAANRIQIGEQETNGLGAGSNPEVGQKSAEENLDSIMEAVSDANMVFITAGMGGGTGTGATPVIAKSAKESGILTVGVVTTPFMFEGNKRQRTAKKGIEELRNFVDTILVIPNEKLIEFAGSAFASEAFQMTDTVLLQAVQGIADLITKPGQINIDFADVCTVMRNKGEALIGFGESEGENRAIEAAQKAISNPLLNDISIHGADSLLINITCGPDMILKEVMAAVDVVKKAANSSSNENENVFFGLVQDPEFDGKVRITVIATGTNQVAKESGKKTDVPSIEKRREEAVAAFSGEQSREVLAKMSADSYDRYEDIPTILRERR